MNEQELREFLARRIAEVRREIEARGPQPWHGFWSRCAPPAPRSIVTPEERVEGDTLAVACTQTALPAAAQKRLVRGWCELLPTLAGVRFLYLASRVPQELFDAACRMPALEGLWVKWSAVKDLGAIEQAHRLRHLHLGSSSGITSIEPLTRRVELQHLGLENLKRVTDLAPLAKLRGLRELEFSGAEGQRNEVGTLAPLAALDGLEWLQLGALHVRDGSLRPLAMLTRLRWLGLGNYFAIGELARLAHELPGTRCSWLAPFETFDRSVFPCGRCKAASKVMTSGKGSRLLCPECDARSLAEHVARWDAARPKVAVQ